MEQQARPDVENVAANDQEEMEDMDMDVGPQSLVVLQVRGFCGLVTNAGASHREQSVFSIHALKPSHQLHERYLLLQNFGISANDIQKLQTAGIHTVEGLAHAPRRELENIKGLSSAKVDKMQKEGKYPSYPGLILM